MANAHTLPAVRVRDARPLFLVAFLFTTLFVQGVRVSNVPLPSLFGLCLVYFLAFEPPLSRNAINIYTLVIGYILFLSTRNALDLTGSMRDFLYLGTCILSLLVTVSLADSMSSMTLRRIGSIILVFFAIETGVIVVQYMNPFGFRSLITPLLQYWADFTRADSFAGDVGMMNRMPGSLGAATTAGFICHLLARSAAICLKRRWVTYLAIIPLVFTGARMASIVFLFWEVVLPIAMSRYRMQALGALLGLVALGAIVCIAIPSFLQTIFLFSSIIDLASPDALLTAASVTNRLESVRFALEHWVEVVTFGGLTAHDFAAREQALFGFDNEIVLRSLQFGFAGYASMVVMNIWTGYDRKDPAWWFVLYIVLAAGLTSALTTNIVAFPFLILYSLCVKVARLDHARSARSLPPQTRTPSEA